MGQLLLYPAVRYQKERMIAMSKRKSIWLHVSFWSVLAIAVTAEGWMDLICRGLFQL